jgi:hypothetical protein
MGGVEFMKKIGFVLALFLLSVYLFQQKNKPLPLAHSKTCSPSAPLTETKNVKFLANTKVARSNGSQPSSREIAESYFEKHRKEWGIKDYHLKNSTEFTSPLGDTFVYEFSQGDIPVVGMRIRLRVGLDGEAMEEENTYKAIPLVEDLDLSAADIQLVLQNKNPRYSVQELREKNQVIFVRENLNQGELAFSIQAMDSSSNNRPTQLLVRASDGKLLQRSVGRSEF